MSRLTYPIVHYTFYILLNFPQLLNGKSFDFAEEFQAAKEAQFNRHTEDSIETLQWAVQLTTANLTESKHDLETFFNDLGLQYHHSVGGNKNWIVIGHPLHAKLHSSLSDIHTYVHNNYTTMHSPSISSHNDRSTAEVIHHMFKRSLEQQHDINDEQWQHLVSDVETTLHKHPRIQRFRMQHVKFRHKRSVHFKDPEFRKQWHLVSALVL